MKGLFYFTVHIRTTAKLIAILDTYIFCSFSWLNYSRKKNQAVSSTVKFLICLWTNDKLLICMNSQSVTYLNEPNEKNGIDIAIFTIC